MTRLEERDNWIMPCLIRDHYRQFRELIREFNLTSEDQNAAATLEDPEYFQSMVAYNQAVAELMEPIWKNEYPKLVS